MTQKPRYLIREGNPSDPFAAEVLITNAASEAAAEETAQAHAAQRRTPQHLCQVSVYDRLGNASPLSTWWWNTDRSVGRRFPEHRTAPDPQAITYQPLATCHQDDRPPPLLNAQSTLKAGDAHQATALVTASGRQDIHDVQNTPCGTQTVFRFKGSGRDSRDFSRGRKSPAARRAGCFGLSHI